MIPSWRKPVGMLALLAAILAWVVLVASFSGIVGGWHWALQLIFYLATGVIWLWILPARRMLKWMETGSW